MEGADAEEQLSQALEYRNSLRRSLFEDEADAAATGESPGLGRAGNLHSGRIGLGGSLGLGRGGHNINNTVDASIGLRRSNGQMAGFDASSGIARGIERSRSPVGLGASPSPGLDGSPGLTGCSRFRRGSGRGMAPSTATARIILNLTRTMEMVQTTGMTMGQPGVICPCMVGVVVEVEARLDVRLGEVVAQPLEEAVVACYRHQLDVAVGSSQLLPMVKHQPVLVDVQRLHRICVDGSTALAPGQGLENDEDIIGAGVNEVFVSGGADRAEQNAPPNMSGSFSQRSLPNNRGGSSSAITSPMKQTKNPMVRVMKSIHATLEANCAIANRVMLGEHLDEKIVEVLDMAVACGASEGSAEHFMATLLFKSAENRSTFKALKTNEGRLAWLKRHCVKEGLV
ncbi:hypothetical protein PR202_gb23817 [Eleusine coracana subsp. coracana]|uniref:Uncharacterized protein n=1 Tax=Eleusine coracana subsp. coracana TaxID=191504 RepID=A0AAV5FH86_ELECO|nr:hypothetical protein PR202_gb23817 [Eleusine coracana subsp. coracana]